MSYINAISPSIKKICKLGLKIASRTIPGLIVVGTSLTIGAKMNHCNNIPKENNTSWAYQAGQQHVKDSLKIVELEQKLKADSLKILHLTEKLKTVK